MWIFFRKPVKIKMMQRHLKQITIVLVYLLLLIVVGGGIYLLARPGLPACDDGIQNQGEVDIDCGGPCSPCPWQFREDLEIIFSEAIKTKDNYVDLVARIKNLNSDWGAELFSYAFDLYDSENNLIISHEGASHVLPLETRYIIKQRVLAESEISNVEFKITDINWQELVDYEGIELLIRNLEFKQSEDSGQLIATLENNSSYDLDRIDVYAVLFDKESKILGVGKLELRTVLSKERRYFEINWFFPIEGEVKEVDVVAKTNVFLDENFMRRYGKE